MEWMFPSTDGQRFRETSAASAFMERAIRDNQFVVIVCTPRYKHRSDAREGGVGYEGDIMTAEVLTSQNNNRKFMSFHVLRRGAWPEARTVVAPRQLLH